ncbi:MAG TPA: hypothetical protein VF188_09860 [Longimicrobiales bacterium]
MAGLSTLDASACDLLRSQLEALDSIACAVVDEGEEAIWLICEPDAEREPIEVAVRRVLTECDLDPDAVPIRIAVRPDGTRRRVRFDGIERDTGTPGALGVRVRLDWNGKVFVGEAAGETGAAIELRTAAAAALDALGHLLGDAAAFRLIGVKQIRAFDADLIVVSVHRTSPEIQRFVGAVLVPSDPLQGAALAVLHALNRILGNLLLTTD